MKGGDAVFFFTLVDFLLTTLFFGVALAVSTADTPKVAEANRDAVEQIAELQEKTGISDFAKLTDELTRLVPLRKAGDAVDVVARMGGIDTAQALVRLKEQAGGSDSLLDKATRFLAREGASRPHCIYRTNAAGRRIPIPLGLIVGTDSGMTFADSTAALQHVLDELGLTYQGVRFLNFEAFQNAFAPLRSKPCEYTVQIREQTNLKYARKAVFGLFYTRFIKP